MTPEYIEKLKSSFPAESDRLENAYNSKLNSAKGYEKLRSDNNRQKKMLESKREKLEAVKSQYSQKNLRYLIK